MRITRIVAGGAALAAAGIMLAAPEAGATRPPSLSISPSAVQPGGAVSASAYCPVSAAPGSSVTSPGLAGPIALHRGDGGYSGTGKAGRKAGTFTATVTCPQVGSVTATFTVKDGDGGGPGNPHPGAPPASSPRAGKPKPPAVSRPQVSVVPRGGVQTGDGSLS